MVYSIENVSKETVRVFLQQKPACKQFVITAFPEFEKQLTTMPKGDRIEF